MRAKLIKVQVDVQSRKLRCACRGKMSIKRSTHNDTIRWESELKNFLYLSNLSTLTSPPPTAHVHSQANPNTKAELSVICLPDFRLTITVLRSQSTVWSNATVLNSRMNWAVQSVFLLNLVANSHQGTRDHERYIHTILFNVGKG